MEIQNTRRQQLAVVGAPAVAVLIAYTVLFHMPLGRTAIKRHGELAKLQRLVDQQRSAFEFNAKKLEAISVEQRELSLALEDSEKTGSHLVSRRASRREELFQSTSPAALVSQCLNLLSRHNLTCLDSSSLAQSGNAMSGHAQSNNSPLPGTSSLSDSLKPLAKLLGESSGTPSTRREVRLKLSGRFLDLRNALQEMQAELPDVFTVSLEMEPADLQTDRRVWVLTVLV